MEGNDKGHRSEPYEVRPLPLSAPDLPIVERNDKADYFDTLLLDSMISEIMDYGCSDTETFLIIYLFFNGPV